MVFGETGCFEAGKDKAVKVLHRVTLRFLFEDANN